MDSGRKDKARVNRLAYAVLFIAAFLFAAAGLRTVILGDSLASRLATVHALTHHHTWQLDRAPGAAPNPFTGLSVDQVEVGGGRISSKPPLLPLLMAGEYGLLHRLFGWSLDEKEDWRAIIQCITFSLVVLAYALTLFLFARTLHFLLDDPWKAFALTAALAFGTEFSGFSSCFNNHVPAAAMLVLCLYLLIGLVSGRLPATPWRFSLFGFAAAMTFAFDLPAAIFPAFAGLYLLWRFPRQALLWGGLGALPPLMVHFIIMGVLTGSPLPVQVNRDCYLYESSFWRNPTGVDALNEPKPTYLFHMTLGRQGIFLLFPVLLFGIAGAGAALAEVCGLSRGAASARRAGLVLGAFAAFVLLLTYYVLHTNNYGGAAYGFRWAIPSMPVLLLMGAPLAGRMPKRVFWMLFIPLLAVSVYSAWECHAMPWSYGREWTVRLLFGPAF